MKKLIFLLAACLLVSFSFTTESEARPKHKRSHYSISKVQKKKVKVVKRAVKPVKSQQVVQQPQVYHDESNAAAFFAGLDVARGGAQRLGFIHKGKTKLIMQVMR